jgi:cell division protein ZapB
VGAIIDIDLASLEAKIRQTAALCQQLRDENRDLRRQLAHLEQDKRALQERIDSARTRLENLLRRIPE